MNHPVARQNGLSPEHVAALRIYTSHLFKYLNGPLRKTSVYGPGQKMHPLPLTMTSLDEAIKRLRAEYVATEKRKRAQEGAERASGSTRIRLYRGMKMLDVGDDFMNDRKGGTEIAPMSTTTDLSVAVHYGLGPSSLLFVLSIDNFMQMGANVQWISAFPAEAEVQRVPTWPIAVPLSPQPLPPPTCPPTLSATQLIPPMHTLHNSPHRCCVWCDRWSSHRSPTCSQQAVCRAFGSDQTASRW